jgi:hypothetical protein
MPLGSWDPGGCNCGLCWPCKLPTGNNLSLSFNYQSAGGTVPLAWTGGGGISSWQSGCVTTGFATSFNFFIHCTSTCTYYQVQSWPAGHPSCSGGVVTSTALDNPSGCSGLTTGVWTINATATTCSPLHVYLTNGGVDYFVITL